MTPDKRDLQVEATRSQALFREVNERVNTLQSGWSAVAELDYVCECADETCSVAVTVEREVYERVRGMPTHFLVAPGHVVEDAEKLIGQAKRHWIVEVIGAGRTVAEETDPRRRRE